MNQGVRLVVKQTGPFVLLPLFVYEAGLGAVLPVVALVALDAGASTTVAGLMLSCLGVGTILGDIPGRGSPIASASGGRWWRPCRSARGRSSRASPAGR